MPPKRNRDGSPKGAMSEVRVPTKAPRTKPHAEAAAPSSPYLPMFQGFRAELDEHHDRRERVIKASRDITASSKKM